jgi:hypothetical protein
MCSVSPLWASNHNFHSGRGHGSCKRTTVARELGGLHGCMLIARCHVYDALVYNGSRPIRGLPWFISHLPWDLRPHRRLPCGSTRRPAGLRLRRGGLHRLGGGLIRRGARRRRVGSYGYRIPFPPWRPVGLPQAPGQPCLQLPLSSGWCTSRVARRGCTRERWRLRFWKVARTLK